MKKAYWMAVVAGLALAPWPAFAQPMPDQATEPAAAPRVIPADQQATKEQLTRLFEVMRLREQFTSMTKMLPTVVQQQMHAQMKEILASVPSATQPTADQQAAIDKLMNKYMEKALSIYPLDEMIDDAVTVYQRHVSRSDVDAYIAFYSSPPGQHLLDAQPVIMHEYMPMVMQRVEERSKELNDEMVKDLQDYLKTQMPAAAPVLVSPPPPPPPGK